MRQNVSTPAFVGILVVVLAIVGWLVWKYVLAPVQSTMPAYSKELAAEYNKKHSESAQEARNMQQQLLRQSQKKSGQ